MILALGGPGRNQGLALDKVKLCSLAGILPMRGGWQSQAIHQTLKMQMYILEQLYLVCNQLINTQIMKCHREK